MRKKSDVQLGCVAAALWPAAWRESPMFDRPSVPLVHVCDWAKLVSMKSVKLKACGGEGGSQTVHLTFTGLCPHIRDTTGVRRVRNRDGQVCFLILANVFPTFSIFQLTTIPSVIKAVGQITVMLVYAVFTFLFNSWSLISIYVSVDLSKNRTR